jgi:bifunctional enzyme CysN/CysC
VRKTVTATVTDLKYKVNVNTMEHLAARSLTSTKSASATSIFDRQIAFDPYTENRDTGGFILIDRLTNNTVGAGLLHFALRRADNIHVQHVDVNKEARSTLKGQKASVLWFTGLSGGQVDDRQPGREEAVFPGAPHLPARW